VYDRYVTNPLISLDSRTFVYPDRMSIETHGSEDGHRFQVLANKLLNLKAQGIPVAKRRTNSQYGKIIFIKDEESISEWYCW
jgi:hypothetical protein